MPQATQLACPVCGAAVHLENRFVKLVVCKYCNSSLFVQNEKLDPTGKTAALVDYPTRFAVGKKGTLRSSQHPGGKSFRVLGRVRFEDEDSFWDEWFLEMEGGAFAWLEEEEGEYSLTRRTPLKGAVPDFDKVRVGAMLTVNGKPFFVTGRVRAQVTGAEGQLFYRARPSQEVRFVDGNIQGRLAAIEYGEDAIEYTEGEVIELDDVVFSEE
jgi:hypothetical protein